MVTDVANTMVLGRSTQDDDDAMENDLIDKIDCHVKVPHKVKLRKFRLIK